MGKTELVLLASKNEYDAGERYISRIRVNSYQPIQDIFSQINERINKEFQEQPEIKDDLDLQKKKIPYLGELYLGHVRYMVPLAGTVLKLFTPFFDRTIGCTVILSLRKFQHDQYYGVV